MVVIPAFIGAVFLSLNESPPEKEGKSGPGVYVEDLQGF